MTTKLFKKTSTSGFEYYASRRIGPSQSAMAAGFVGLTIVVTLKSPANTVLQGLVADVHEQSSTLLLQNVVLLATGHRFESLSVEGTQIADIKLVGDPSIPSAPPPAPQDNQSQAPEQPPATKPQTFVDPAILSFGKKPLKPVLDTNTVIHDPNPIPSSNASSTPIKAAAAVPLPATTSPFVGKPGPSSPDARPSGKRGSDATVTLTTGVTGLAIAPDAGIVDESDEPATVEGTIRRASITKTRTGKPMDGPVNGTDAQKKKRRAGKNKRKEVLTEDAPVQKAAVESELSPEVARTPGSSRKRSQVRGNGWRDTPILQEEPTNALRTPGVIGGQVGLQAVSSSKRKNRRQRATEAQSGWATEDATDIGQLPDFDFESNLSKFDKRTVFDQIRNEDTTADEDRLVSFNRLPSRPGTFGGQKLHPTEAVLDSKPHYRTSESSSDEFDFDSGRNSRRAMSRASTMRAPVRSNSGVQEDSIPLNPSTAGFLNRSRRSLNNPAYASSHPTGSPRPVHFSPPASPSASQPSQQLQPGFRLVSSNHTCPTVTPGGMAAIEEVAEAEFGLSSDIQTENAARGIAEIAMSALNPGGRRLARDNINAKPVVVVLAGNHRAGSRAIAAARHLQARGLRVMACILGYERGLADGDKDLRRQVELLRKLGGLVRGWSDVERYLKKLDAPPELIVDALLAPSRDFEALGVEDQDVCLNMVGWANKSRAQVLSVDAPSGVNGSTGEISILEGEPLEVRAKFVVCIGAPHTGILRALQAGEGAHWQLWVVDVGVNKAWKQYGAAGSRCVRFGMEWVAPVKFVTGESDAQ